MTNEELAHLEKEKEHKERDARMKYGKRYKENCLQILELKVFVFMTRKVLVI